MSIIINIYVNNNIMKLITKIKTYLPKFLISLVVAMLVMFAGCEDDNDTPVPEIGKEIIPELNWCYGGFNGSNAVYDPNVNIVGIRQLGGNLYYSWNCTSPSFWGVTVPTNADHLFCLFFKDPSGKWKGGKIDWVSYSRVTRDLHNPSTGYKGWNWAEYCAATECAVMVVSKNAKYRSNFATFTK